VLSIGIPKTPDYEQGYLNEIRIEGASDLCINQYTNGVQCCCAMKNKLMEGNWGDGNIRVRASEDHRTPSKS
jgi:hypothetical protein